MPCLSFSKVKKLHFSSNPTLSYASFDVIHLDTSGPFHVPIVEGHRFFLTIVDDHSRYTWTYMLKTELEVITVFPNFYTMFQTQFNISIKSVRCDNASELAFVQIFKEKAFHLIIHAMVDLKRIL